MYIVIVVLTIDLAFFSAANLCSATVVSAGLLRVFGREVAELPLVATRVCSREKVMSSCPIYKPYLGWSILFLGWLLRFLSFHGDLYKIGLLSIALFLRWEATLVPECRKHRGSSSWRGRALMDEQIWVQKTRTWTGKWIWFIYELYSFWILLRENLITIKPFIATAQQVYKGVLPNGEVQRSFHAAETGSSAPNHWQENRNRRIFRRKFWFETT